MTMPIRSLIPLLGLSLALYACGSSQSGTFASGGQGRRLASWKEPNPYGMVKIPRGHITLGRGATDSLWHEQTNERPVSVEAFWMDKHEVTNADYRAFVYYVRDSILRERLADPRYGGDERYKITEDKDGEPIQPRLNWSLALPSESRASEEELKALTSLYYTNPITGEKRLDARQLLYRYEVYDHRAAVRYGGKLREVEKNPSWHKREELPLISKDTAYIAPSGGVVRQRIRRRLSGEYDFVNTYIVAIHPDEDVWLKDWPNSTNEVYSRRYFQHPGYDDYPVVGVSWEQANAYCAWRTEQYRKSVKLPAGQTVEAYRLPTEAEFEYAARAGQDKQTYPWSSPTMLGRDDCLCGNFKPADGNYTADKHLITAPVESYSPNEYGLFDVGGNVAEWTSTVYSPSGLHEVDDLNPELSYAVAPNEPYSRSRKVVKGGSWKDVAKYVRAGSRVAEYQDRGRSYIGFRCVRTAIDFDK